MSRIEVLGPPFPDVDPRYCGTDRVVPSVREDLGLDHIANRALLRTLEGRDDAEQFPNKQSAQRLVLEYGPEDVLGHFDIVEVTELDEEPREGRELLGLDVAVEGGLTSLIAAVLLSNDALDPTVQPHMEGHIRALRAEFLQSLNGNLLFPNRESAERFLRAALDVGPWEGPEISWVPVRVWAVPLGD